MKNFFLVSVATGIFSGTTLTAIAQPSVNLEQVHASPIPKKTPQFIDNIEINRASSITVKPVTGNTIQSSKKISYIEEKAAIECFIGLQFKYAQLLDVEVESINNLALFAQIEKWQGTRYMYGGATEKGIDCSAYTATIAHNIYGLVLARTASEQYTNSIKLDKEELQMGDLVFFKTRRSVSHVGMYLGNGNFTHASTSIGVTISNLEEDYWRKKFIGGGRLTVPAAENEQKK